MNKVDNISDIIK